MCSDVQNSGKKSIKKTVFLKKAIIWDLTFCQEGLYYRS